MDNAFDKMIISTKRGDKGKTDTLNRRRILKSDPEIEFLGSVDELQAWIGVSELDVEVKEQIQKELYEIMSGSNIEPWFDTKLHHEGRFTISSTWINVARTVCRRAERAGVKAEMNYAIPYLNRLSDYLYKQDQNLN